jgi:hypothetical protein
MTKSISDILKEQKEISKNAGIKLTDSYINQCIGIQNRTEDPEWKALNEARYDDPEYAKRVGKKISETYSTAQGRAVQAAKSKPHTEDAKKKIADANTGLVKGPEIRAKLSVKKIGNNHRARPIITPLGIFPSRKDAAEAYLASGKANALRWIEKWLKTDPKDFYYISKEEYIMLTGKDI